MQNIREYEIYRDFFNKKLVNFHFVHAKVTILIRMSPMADKASAHATSVAPVVSTSSTSRICFPAKDAASAVAQNNSCTFSQRA